MKKFAVRIAALVVLQSGALLAQNLAGTWQGLMLRSQAPGDTLRVVFKISTNDAGTFVGTMYSIDQGGQAPAPDITLKGTAVKITMPSIGAMYTGTMSPDGNSITGKWNGTKTVGANPLTLNLARAIGETAWKIPEPPPPPRMMPQDADPTFEVAIVKLTNPDQRGGGIRMQGRQFSASNLSVNDLITIAYGIHPRQLVGGPDWIEKDRYDVLGKPDVEGQPNNRQIQALFRKLLDDRFRLKFHREKRELSIYAMVAGKTGITATKSEGDPNGDPNMFMYGPGQFIAKNARVSDFASFIQRGIVDRPVIDQTGLTARYDFGLVWRPDQIQPVGNNPPPPSDRDAFPDIFGAVQQQLGLRLEGMKTPTEVIVVDRLEKPTEN
jgi:uncharacterized protein (TIGR03435 family)